MVKFNARMRDDKGFLAFVEILFSAKPQFIPAPSNVNWANAINEMTKQVGVIVYGNGINPQPFIEKAKSNGLIIVKKDDRAELRVRVARKHPAERK